MKNEDDSRFGTEFDPIIVLEQAILSGKKMSDNEMKELIFVSFEYYGYPFGVFAFFGILSSVAEPWLGEAGRNFSEGLRNNLLDWYVWSFLIFVLAWQCTLHAITGSIDTTISRGRLRLMWDSIISTTRLTNLCIASFVVWGGYAFGVLMFVTLLDVYKELVSGPISINPFSKLFWPEMHFMWIASCGVGIVLTLRLKTIEWVHDPRCKTKKLGLCAFRITITCSVHLVYVFSINPFLLLV